MRRTLMFLCAGAIGTFPALAAEITYRNDIAPIIKAQCADCHGADSPSIVQFKTDEEGYKK